MTTERSLARARQEQEFNPDEHDSPVEVLAGKIRCLPVGGRVRLPDDTLIISRTIPVGPSQVRRFSVVPPTTGSTAVQRHRIVAMGHGACKTAQEAALKALKRGE